MGLVGIIGEPGSGKTNLMTALLYKAHRRGRKVIANYPLHFPHTRMDFETLSTLPPMIANAVVGMDESGLGIDAYDFWSQQARKLTRLGAEWRKRGMDLYYTVQFGTWVALRLRQSTMGRIVMEDLDSDIKHCRHFSTPCPGEPECAGYVCRGEFRCWFYDKMGRFIRRERFHGNPYWKLYDTGYII